MTNESIATPPHDSAGAAAPLHAWQQRMRPLMVRMVVVLAVFFFLATLAQLVYLHWTARQVSQTDVSDAFSTVTHSSSLSGHDSLILAQVKVFAVLEANSTERFYHQANVMLMSRIWIHYLGFVTGMILTLVGSAFILGRLREPVSELDSKTALASLTLRSTSPGLILAALGVLLMLTTVVTHHEIEITDRPVFTRSLPIPPSDDSKPLKERVSLEDPLQAATTTNQALKKAE